MMRNLTKIAVAVFLSAGLAVAGGASAELIAGWDFSQYSSDGSLNSGGGNADTLAANYACPSVNSGTLYMDGSLGSTDVDELATFSDVLPEVVARANPTHANRTAPLDCDSLPTPAFDEPPAAQPHKSQSGLLARVASDVVFQGTRPASLTGDWKVSFAAFNTTPGPVSVGVEFAADCGGYSLVDTVSVVPAERSYEVPLSAGLSDDEVCVRLALPAGAGVDNVAIIALPELAGSTAMLAGVTGLLALVRVRSRNSA